MLCPQCGTSNVGEARFCQTCGANLKGSEPVDPFSVPDAFRQGLFPAAAAPPDALLGRVIDNRYRLEERIGAGGMGAVYRATRLNIGDEVAVKILHAERTGTPDSFARFKREAQTAARIRHPNAVSIYDFGMMEDGLQYLVMELLEGKSLGQLIKEQGTLPATTVAEIITQACAALDEAHRQHVVHRDIKPDNIIVHPTHSGLRVKVLDFGVAKLRDDTASNITQTGSVMGTPHYMSPEQCLGEELDARSDIYSLGVVLYEMLCGAVPFNAPVSTAVVVQQVNQPPPPMREKNPAVTPALEAVVRKALEKQRDARQQTAGALAQQFFAAVYGHAPARPYVDAIPAASASAGDELAASRDAARATPVSGSVTNSMAHTIHFSASRPSSGAAVPTPRPAPKTGRTLILTSALVTILVAALVVGAAALMLRSRGGERGGEGARETQRPQTATTSVVAPPKGMVYVPGGEFLMGSASGDEFERPPHKVSVKPFFIDVYEVTCEEYKKFMEATAHRAPAGWVQGSFLPGAERRPVTGVNWDDAVAYARWAGKRLPTEEEWEFAARGTDGRIYPWGNDWRDGLANAGGGNKCMADVGAYKGASPFGLFDMIGNAWEWTASDISAYPGGLKPEAKKPDAKIIRGGYFGSVDKKKMTATFRGWWGARDEDDYSNTGFRCAQDAPVANGS